MVAYYPTHTEFKGVTMWDDYSIVISKVSIYKKSL